LVPGQLNSTGIIRFCISILGPRWRFGNIGEARLEVQARLARLPEFTLRRLRARTHRRVFVDLDRPRGTGPHSVRTRAAEPGIPGGRLAGRATRGRVEVGRARRPL
jgi:hypothetical protein